jgi:hypothetical protein
MISSSVIANHIDDIEDAKYVTLRVGDETVTLKVFQGGVSKYSIKVDANNVAIEDAQTLAEAIDHL